jgi:hypothetical protein
MEQKQQAEQDKRARAQNQNKWPTLLHGKLNIFILKDF